jgi:uncharacterized DUF497 family protein
MRFEWDEQKRQSSIQKHGLDFADAPTIFGGFMIADHDRREEYGEERFIGTGVLNTIIVAVVYTEPDENTIRIISLRKATRDERRQHEQAIRDRLGTP